MSGWQIFIVSVLGTIPAICAGAAGLVLALARIREVHKIVNQQRTDMMAEIDALKKIVASYRVVEGRRGL